MKKIILIILVIIALVILAIAGNNIYQVKKQADEISKLPSYYQSLIKECEDKGSYSCCKVSADYMLKGNFKIAPEAGCAEGYQGNMLKCIDSYKWCEPVKNMGTVKPQVNTNIYQNDEYGFQITLTENWKNHKTKIIEETDGDKIIKFCANIPDSEMYTEIPGYHCLFNVTISDKIKWDKDTEPCRKDRNSGMCDWIDNELGRNSDYVFSCGAAQDYGDKEEKYFKDISIIIDSFKIIKN